MFDSEKSLEEVIQELREEVDVAPEIDKKSYVEWTNSLEQLLYSEIIRERGAYEVDISTAEQPEKGTFLFKLPVDAVHSNEKPLTYENIDTLFVQWANGTKKRELTKADGMYRDIYYRYGKTMIHMIYYKEDDKICVITGKPSVDKITIYYVPCPKLKSVSTDDKVVGNVALPIEFIELLKSKLRAEAYKIMNEDLLSAKWMNDYNVLLENFKAWIAEKKPIIGK